MSLETATIVGNYKFVESIVDDEQVRVYQNIGGTYIFIEILNSGFPLALYKEIAKNKRSQKEEELIQVIKHSLPEMRMIEVVYFAGIKINGEIVQLKNRSSYIPNDLIEYNESFIGKWHDLDLIRGKNIIFGHQCFSRRGLEAMLTLGELKANKEFKVE